MTATPDPTTTNFRTDTLDALYDLSIEGLPERANWDLPIETPSEANDRYVVIAEEVTGDEVYRHFGGCWPEANDALRSYDWSYGPPVFLVDLWVAPEQAAQRIELTPALTGAAFNLSDEIA